jgi:hypothetical protein
VPPEKVMSVWGAMVQIENPGARHVSTRWLWKDQDVQEAIRYVVEEQGDPMTVFVAGMG